MKKNIIQILSIIFVVIAQVSIIQPLFPPIRYLNLPLIIILLLIIRGNYQLSLYWAFGSGIFLGIFEYHRFGMDALIFIAIAILINFLYNNLFTNASMVSLILLGIIAQSAYIISHWLLIALLFYAKIYPFAYSSYFRFSMIFQEMAINLFFLIAWHMLFNIKRNKMQEKF